MLMRRSVARAGTAVAALAGCSVSFAAPTADAPAARSYNTVTSAGYQPARPFRVGVLGATGAVGQRFLQHLDGHPWFRVTRLGASERSAGKPYAEAANWMVSPDVPAYLRGMKVVGCMPEDFGGDVDLVFSALVRARGCGGGGARRPALSIRPHIPAAPSIAGRARCGHRRARLPRRGRARL